MRNWQYCACYTNLYLNQHFGYSLKKSGGKHLARHARILTDRQRSVMERIDRRVPIKVMAQELGISETRVNQHIRALKDIYGTESLNELVEVYRRDRNGDAPDGASNKPQLARAKNIWAEPIVERAAPESLVPVSLDSQASLPDWTGHPDGGDSAADAYPIAGFLDGPEGFSTRCGVMASVFSLLLTSILISAVAGRLIGSAVN